MDLNCLHFDSCSGCLLKTRMDEPPVLQEARVYFAEKGVESFPFHVGSPHGWRTRARLAIRGTAEQPLVGLYKTRTHDVVDIPLCRVQHPDLNRAVDEVRRWIQSERIAPYDEKVGKGVLRYLQLTLDRGTGKIQGVLVVNGDRESEKVNCLKKKMKKLWECGTWHSLWLNFNTSRANVILGKEWELWGGETFLWDHIAGVDVCFHPASFIQGNREMFEKLLKRVIEEVSEGAAVAEFYSGVGVIGLALAHKCRLVKCCEIVDAARECFEKSRHRLLKEVQGCIRFEVGDATSMKELAVGVDTVVVDPPRKGLDASMISFLTETEGIERLVYISCGWKALQRDCDALLSLGWKLTSAEGFLFFPGTNHIETLCFFSK